MAVGQNLLFGRMKNKIGGIVTSTWKGINVIKSKPLTVANPKTDLQLMRREALIKIMAVARAISSAIQIGFKEQAVFKSAFNAFVGYCLRNAFDYSGPPTADLIPGAILVSQGTISVTPVTSWVADESLDTIVVNWAMSPLLPGQSNADKVALVVRGAVNLEFIVPVGTGAVRSAGVETFTLPDRFLIAGEVVNIYMFMYNTASRKSSDSVFAQQVVVA